MSNPYSAYDLKSVNLPRLAGTGIALFTALLENPLTRPLLIGNLLDTGGVTKLRSLKPAEPPTFLPLVAPTSESETPALDIGAISQAYAPARGHAYPTVRDYAQAYRSGRLTPEEVAGRVLAAIKDELDVTGYPTTCGTSFLGAVAKADSTVAARLRAAGAILIGKTNMHEIGINPFGSNAHHGFTRNPYNPNHYPGGSSSGSAAAVAAGLCPVAIGADGGGSVRIPSALCGVVGLKPTFGRVSEYGAFPLCWSVAHIGPIASNVTDCALAYAIIAGPDPQDPNSLVQSAVTLDQFANSDLSGLTVGIFRDWFDHATPEIVQACQAALKTLEGMGATIHPIEIPELDAQRVAHALTILSEMAAEMQKYAEHNSEHSREVRLSLELGRACTSRDYLQSQRIRTRAMAYFANALKQVDVIITPTTAVTAPPILPDALPEGESDLSTTVELMRFVTPGNFAGMPALSVPVGYDSNGLPIGLQVMGRHWDEAKLLRIAHALEGSLEKRAPRVQYKILEN